MNTPQLQSFELDGVRFVQDIRAGKDRGESTPDEFILVKTNAFLTFYRGLQQRKPKTILEIGMFEGGIAGVLRQALPARKAGRGGYP